MIYQTGNVACELGETIRSAHFYVKVLPLFLWAFNCGESTDLVCVHLCQARECFVTALKLGSQPHYEKEVTEKALALMERAETVRYYRSLFRRVHGVVAVGVDPRACACRAWCHRRT